MTEPMAATARASVPITLGRNLGRRVAGTVVSFAGLADGREHIAVVVPPITDPALVRMHSECLTGDVLGSARCDCGPQLDEAMRMITEDGGVLLYLRQEGRGIGLYNKLDAYVLQDAGVDTYQANELVGRRPDERDYLVGAQMLRALDIARIKLLTNNDDKARELRRHGIDVESVIPTSVFLTDENARYLAAKARVAGHRLPVADEVLGALP
jgi:GTP cyclohydrolase II